MFLEYIENNNKVADVNSKITRWSSPEKVDTTHSFLNHGSAQYRKDITSI
jgi:hypothetical protein